MRYFEPTHAFRPYHTQIFARFYQNAKALESGEAKSFAFCAFVPDEHEAEVRAFCDAFNAAHSGAYLASVKNEDGLLLIRIGSTASLIGRLFRRLRVPALDTLAETYFSGGHQDSRKSIQEESGSFLKKRTKKLLSLRLHDCDVMD